MIVRFDLQVRDSAFKVRNVDLFRDVKMPFPPFPGLRIIEDKSGASEVVEKVWFNMDTGDYGCSAIPCATDQMETTVKELIELGWRKS